MPKIKHGAYVINLDVYKSIATRSIALYVNGDNVTFVDSFKVEYIPKEIEKFMGHKNITTSIYRIQANDSVIGWYFCIDLSVLC